MALKLLSIVLLVAVLVGFVTADCPNNCGNVGTCVNNRCLCPSYRGGPDCSALVYPIGLPPGQPQWVGGIYYGKFDMFKADLNLGTSYTFTVTELNGHTCRLYAGLGFIPTYYEFSYASTIPHNNTLAITLRPDNVNQSTVYVGVSALSWTNECSYRIIISYAQVAPNYQVITKGQSYVATLPSSKTDSLNFLLHTSYSSSPYTINMTSNCTSVLRLRYGAIPTSSYYYAVYYNYYTHTHYDFSNTYFNSSLYFSLGRVYTSDRVCVVTFVVTQPDAPTCVSQCSLHGTCIYSTCRCNYDYYGSFCQEKQSYLRTDEVASGFVDNGLANFFKYDSNTINPLYIYFNTTSSTNTNVSESCSFYISKSTYPSPSRYDYSYVDIQNTYGEKVLMEIPQGGVQVWYLSVYGSHQCHYSLQVSSTSICGAGCVPPYGTCPSNSTGQCLCLGQYTGPDCRSIATDVSGDGTVMNGAVAMGAWQYYRYNVTQEGDWKLSVTLVSSKTGLYVNEQSYTTLQGSTYRDIGGTSHQVTVTNSLPVGEYYYIGVYGSFIGQTPAQYQLSTFVTPF